LKREFLTTDEHGLARISISRVFFADVWDSVGGSFFPAFPSFFVFVGVDFYHEDIREKLFMINWWQVCVCMGSVGNI
jgi:hypothetical protein